MIQLEDYVSLDIARKLKDYGFPLFQFHYDDPLFNYYGTLPNFGNSTKDEYYLIPTLYQVQKWLYNEKRMWIEISRYDEEGDDGDHGFSWIICSAENYRIPLDECVSSQLPEKPEDALREAIEKAVKLLSKKIYKIFLKEGSFDKFTLDYILPERDLKGIKLEPGGSLRYYSLSLREFISTEIYKIEVDSIYVSYKV